MAEALLELRDVRAGYGDGVVLDGVSLSLPAGGSLACSAATASARPR